jgi:hypothetical protein
MKLTSCGECTTHQLLWPPCWQLTCRRTPRWPLSAATMAVEAAEAAGVAAAVAEELADRILSRTSRERPDWRLGCV